MILHPLGIDVSKLKLDACLVLPTGKLRHKVFPNNRAGFLQFTAWLLKHKVERVHACLEATGAYSEPLALYLHAAGQTVSVVNPARIKAHAQSNLSRTKTDKVDAALIADFCATKHPAPWQPPPTQARELQALVRRLESLQEMSQMEQNRLDESRPTERVAASLRQHLTYLDQEIASTQVAISEHIDQYPGLRQQRDLLVSIPGVGETTAAKLLGENLPTNIQQSSSKKPFGTTCWAKYGHIPVLQSLEGNHTKRIHFRLSPNDRLGPRSSTCAVAGRAKRARARAHRGGSRRHSLAAEGDARMTGRDSHPSPASVTLR